MGKEKFADGNIQTIELNDSYRFSVYIYNNGCAVKETWYTVFWIKFLVVQDTLNCTHQ